MHSSRRKVDPNSHCWRAKLRGLRFSVAPEFNLVANGMTPAQIVAEHSDPKDEDIRHAVGYTVACDHSGVDY